MCFIQLGRKQCSQQHLNLSNKDYIAAKQAPELKRVSAILTTKWRHGSLFGPCYEQWFVQSECFPSDD